MNEEIPADVIETFEAAVEHIKKANARTDHMLKLYGLFKQATVGDCRIPAPKMMKLVASAKWKAWKANEGLSVLDAMNNYVDYVAKISKDFKPAEIVVNFKSYEPVAEQFSDLPPEAPPRKHGRRRKTLEAQRDIEVESGFDPTTETVDTQARMDLYERVSTYYTNVESTRLNQGIGDVVDLGLEKGEEYLNKQLKKKYGVDMDEVERRYADEEKRKIEAATLQRQKVVEKTASKEDPLEKQLTQFYWKYDPSRLTRGIDDIIRFAHNKGMDILNQKLFKKYGATLDSMGADGEIEEPNLSSQTSNSFQNKQNSMGSFTNSSDSLGKLGASDLMGKVELPNYIRPYLMNFYAKYEPSKIRNGGVRTVYEWTERNGLPALNRQLKRKYNESLDEFISSVNNLRTELISFYTQTDKQRLIGGIDEILNWGIKNGRAALNRKLRDKYGYDLNNFEDNDLLQDTNEPDHTDVAF
mmetsp:Transcript_23145/g.28445  ORF Transcript_23145/g.28445 Transcript_23145/m.28445 type:complete len:470 (+) Transcript_23145:169-1578(+)|eukprot:CAMPEP_0204868388 /NCGR_PEP_ID=MMETSP1348-20121228/26410_1 /ASSEMBLY_ACC=CAM_ASM_000700 /TAXON_ID=215587 /ORGANISM="Aplanochytrium stocchinoi, Strain GSBS06" /LENGTH=469 /DNA_ID=CAMNT_0052021295 /DNA_START=110 /DNA_END=1519 /DNA_ORIENTATION=+